MRFCSAAIRRWPIACLPKMLDDPSLEMRRDAVARVIADADRLAAAEPLDQAQTVAAYRRASTPRAISTRSIKSRDNFVNSAKWSIWPSILDSLRLGT